MLHVRDGTREWSYLPDRAEAWVQRAGAHQVADDLLDPAWLPAEFLLSVAGRSHHEGRAAIEPHGRRRLREGGFGTFAHPGAEEVRDVVDATDDVRVASGIISVDRFDRAAVAAAYAQIDATPPGRFIVGLGGAHGPKPAAARIAQHLRAGADQVALSVLSAGPPGSLPVEQWRRLASTLIPDR
jgi:hypothetical protein